MIRFDLVGTRKYRNQVAARRVLHGGATFLELLVVLLVLVSLVVMVLPALTIRVPVAGSTKNAQEVATMATLSTVREAIAGQHGLLENLAHQPEALAIKTSELVREEPPDALRKVAPELTSYHPALGIGWQGPYLLPTGINQWGEPTVIDGWGNEIEIQLEVEQHVETGRRLVTGLHIISKGPDGLLQTDTIKLRRQEREWTTSPEQVPENDDVVVSVPIPSQQP